jgi:bleomycin hydrolase
MLKQTVLIITLCTSVILADNGNLSPETVTELQQTFVRDTHTTALQNALNNTPIKALAQNRQVLSAHNTTFSHKVKAKGISNQKSSGRCWMFAGFNTLRPMIMKNRDLDEFEFSHIYLQFWDKLEKANAFLEYMIEFRDRDVLDRDISFLMKAPCPDGGYWENFVDLVRKYGVIPKVAMAETTSSEATGMMNKNLNRVLRKHGGQMRQVFQKTGSVERMRAAKTKALADIYRILVMNLGQPPKEFTWRYKIKKDKDKDKDTDEKEADQKKEDYEVAQALSALKTYTPKSFYAEHIGVDLSDYVNIADDPIRPKGTHCEILITKNMSDGQNAHYANVSMDVLKKVALAMLLDNQVVWFAADVSPNQDSTKGIMEASLYDYESVYALDMSIDKRQRLLFRDSTVNHAMAFIGVDLVDSKPVKWLVENSWGSERGKKGLWTMYDNWFEANVFTLITHKRYVSDEVLKILEKPVQKQPVWDPMW